MPLAPQISITPITVTSSNMTVTSVIGGGDPATTEQLAVVNTTAQQALADAAAAQSEAANAIARANSALQTSANTIVNASNQLTAINSGGITVYSGTSATSGARVLLNSLGLVGFDTTSTSNFTGRTFSIDATSGSVYLKGEVIATTGTFTGTIYATTGTFTGFVYASGGTFTGTITGATINGGTITIGSGSSIFKADSNGIYLGSSTFASAPFRVTPAGDLTAASATITGTINNGSKLGATSGGFDIGTDRISYGTDVVFYASGSGLYALDTTRTIQANIFTATSSGNAIVAQNGNIYAAAGNISAAGSISGGNITSDTNRFYMASPPSIGSANGTMMRWHTTNHYMGIDSSSCRFKENIVDAGDIKWGNVLSQLRPVTFTRKDDETNTVNLGYIAEEFAEIPEMRFVVVNDENGAPFSISYDYLSVYAIEAIKEANTKIASLESKVSDLETRLAALETKTA